MDVFESLRPTSLNKVKNTTSKTNKFVLINHNTMKLKVLLLLVWFLLFEVTDAGICKFCKKDFKWVGRHEWRCKSRILTVTTSNVRENINTADIATRVDNRANAIERPEVSIANLDNQITPSVYPPACYETTEECDENEQHNDDESENDINSLFCYCGKRCKGLRGLQAHKRACRMLTIPDLRSLYEAPPQNFVTESDDEEITPSTMYEKINILKGVKLPKTQQQWERANQYFSLHVPHGEDITDIEETIRNLQSTLYDYFAKTCGMNVNTSNADLAKVSKWKLKKRLREEKAQNPPNVQLIKLISRQLR